MKERLLRILQLPERPEPPPGAGDSLVVFRASPRFYHYSLLGWALKQAGGLVGIVIPLVVLGGWTAEVFGGVKLAAELYERTVGRPIAADLIAMGLVTAVEAFAVVAYLAQLVTSGLLLKLGWEMRWYMVSDESLRIREGLVRMREQTLRVANIQNLMVRQGPIQRRFGIADLEVHTAGGGKREGGSEGEGGDKHAHVGRFRGLEDADALRDRLQRLVSRHGGTGLGEGVRRPAVRRRTGRPLAVDARTGTELARLLAEARRLRRALLAGQGQEPT